MIGTQAAEEEPGGDWAAEVRRLAAQRDAVILAHNYQAPEIQDIADHTGDSLALSRLAAASTASVIVFAGVYFMAETAKILAPDRTVLIPEPRAGCSLADTITAQQVRDWKAGHPGAVVVAYVNTSAEVKAESDLCCTSANAAQIVASIPPHREVLFLPDQFLGAHVRRVTGRANMHVWLGECHVHAGISPAELRRKASAQAQAELFIHPECGCSTAALWQAGEGDLPPGRTRVLSTGGMLEAARTTTAAGCSAFHSRTCCAVIVSASEQPARGSGISTVRSGARILAVSAMKYTPANTIVRAVLAAARRDRASESPTWSATSWISGTW